MRTLKFKVDKQIINKDPTCDFTGLVAGTEGYLQAEFSFSSEWDGCIKVADFSCRGKECPPQVLENNKCVIPNEALIERTFSVRIIGKRKNLKLTTNKAVVVQNGR